MCCGRARPACLPAFRFASATGYALNSCPLGDAALAEQAERAEFVIIGACRFLPRVLQVWNDELFCPYWDFFLSLFPFVEVSFLRLWRRPSWVFGGGTLGAGVCLAMLAEGDMSVHGTSTVLMALAVIFSLVLQLSLRCTTSFPLVMALVRARRQLLLVRALHQRLGFWMEKPAAVPQCLRYSAGREGAGGWGPSQHDRL